MIHELKRFWIFIALYAIIMSQFVSMYFQYSKINNQRLSLAQLYQSLHSEQQYFDTLLDRQRELETSKDKVMSFLKEQRFGDSQSSR